MRSDWPEGLGRTTLKEVDSTNSYAVELALEGAPSTWIRADKQVQGKGSRGRAWSSQPGNFFGSLVFRPEGDANQAALRSFTASISVAQALESFGVERDQISLKWPNDVLLNKKKIAGILLESSGAGNKIEYLVVGLGINLISFPPRILLRPGGLEATSVKAETGLNIRPDDMLDALAKSFDELEKLLNQSGFGEISKLWLQKAAFLGEEISLQWGDKTLRGRFKTIDETGALVLTTKSGEKVISAGEMVFPDTV